MVVGKLLCYSRLHHISSRNTGILSYVNDLTSRQLIQNSYPTDLQAKYAEKLQQLPPVIYAGFDPTADSLHIGNLMVLINLLRACNHGCRVIAIVGGATGAIGDPSGRNVEREETPLRLVSENAEAITSQILSIAKNILPSMSNFKIVNNMDWCSKMSMVDYLRACKKMRSGELQRVGAIKSRLADSDGISHTEYSYPTVQALDWKILSEKYDCFFQIGGSDQLGHLDFGAHNINRVTGRFAAGICLPLITDRSGKKLGKSVGGGGGGVWLSTKRTSSYHFFQYLRQLHDIEAENMYRFMSLNSLSAVSEILCNHNANLGKWVVQEALANELTFAVHGQAGVDSAIRCTNAIFNGSMDDVRAMNGVELMDLFGDSIEVEKQGVLTMGDLADKTRIDKQKGSILMTKGAFKVNGEKITDPLAVADFTRLTLPNTRNLGLICWGKRKYSLVKFV